MRCWSAGASPCSGVTGSPDLGRGPRDFRSACGAFIANAAAQAFVDGASASAADAVATAYVDAASASAVTSAKMPAVLDTGDVSSGGRAALPGHGCDDYGHGCDDNDDSSNKNGISNNNSNNDKDNNNNNDDDAASANDNDDDDPTWRERMGVVEGREHPIVVDSGSESDPDELLTMGDGTKISKKGNFVSCW